MPIRARFFRNNCTCNTGRAGPHAWCNCVAAIPDALHTRAHIKMYICVHIISVHTIGVHTHTQTPRRRSMRALTSNRRSELIDRARCARAELNANLAVLRGVCKTRIWNTNALRCCCRDPFARAFARAPSTRASSITIQNVHKSSGDAATRAAAAAAAT